MNKYDDDLKLLIDDVEVDVEWEDNDSVKAIKELAKNGGLQLILINMVALNKLVK